MAYRKEKKQQKKLEFPITHDGGLKHTEQFLGFRNIQDLDLSLDVVFVLIDIEVSKQEGGKPAPRVE
jgi:hypothetical protein